MKKILLLSVLSLSVALFASAAQVSFTLQSLQWSTSVHPEYGEGYQLSGAEGLNVGLYKATSMYDISQPLGSYFVIQQNQVMTLATIGRQRITKVVVTCQKPTRTSGIYFNSELIEPSGSTVTWTGGSTSLKMKFGGLSHVTNIEVEYEGEAVKQVEKPVIAPASGTYFEPFTCSVSTATEGATLYYSVNGADFQIYEGPFEVSEGCSISVKGQKEGYEDSEITTVSYAFLPLYDVSSIAEAKNYTDTEQVVRFTNDVVVTYQKNSQFYTYVRDNTGSLLIFGTLPDYSNGDAIPAGFYGKVVNDHGLLKLTTTVDVDVRTNASFREAEDHHPELAAPVLLTKTADVSADMQSEYVAFNYVLFDSADLYISNGTKLPVNNFFEIALPENGIWNVTGILAVWNDVVEFYVTDFSEDPVGIQSLSGSAVSITAKDGCIRVDAPGQPIAVYAADGRLMGRTQHTIVPPGLYVVKAGGTTQKVLLAH